MNDNHIVEVHAPLHSMALRHVVFGVALMSASLSLAASSIALLMVPDFALETTAVFASAVSLGAVMVSGGILSRAADLAEASVL